MAIWRSQTLYFQKRYRQKQTNKNIELFAPLGACKVPAQPKLGMVIEEVRPILGSKNMFPSDS